jgi:hypothetical protein
MLTNINIYSIGAWDMQFYNYIEPEIGYLNMGVAEQQGFCLCRNKVFRVVIRKFE